MSIIFKEYQYIEPWLESDSMNFYKAFHPSLNVDVFIKVLKDTAPDLVENEKELLNQFQHPYTVGLIDSGTINNNPCLVFKYIHGLTLAQFGLEFPVLIQKYILKLIQPLEKLHEKGFIHGDIKPENVMVTLSLDPVLLDFGFVKRIEETEFKNAFRGSPMYCAPEHFNEVQIGPYTDIFTFGLLMYFMLTGEHYFEGLTFQEIQLKLLEGEVHLDAIDSKWQPLLRKCLAVKPEDRYEDFEELGENIELIEVLSNVTLPEAQNLIAERLQQQFLAFEKSKIYSVLEGFERNKHYNTAIKYLKKYLNDYPDDDHLNTKLLEYSQKLNQSFWSQYKVQIVLSLFCTSLLLGGMFILDSTHNTSIQDYGRKLLEDQSSQSFDSLSAEKQRPLHLSKRAFSIPGVEDYEKVYLNDALMDQHNDVLWVGYGEFELRLILKNSGLEVNKKLISNPGEKIRIVE